MRWHALDNSLARRDNYLGNNCLIAPNAENRKKAEEDSSADIRRCWTCGSCDFECPVNIATGRLRPQKVVRLANLGLLGELLHLPEIWYCLTCQRCKEVCPNAVSPATLIEYIREDALFSGIVSMDAMRLYHDLFARFQRVRWHTVKRCYKAELENFTDRMWHDWLEKPVHLSTSLIKQQGLIGISKSSGL